MAGIGNGIKFGIVVVGADPLHPVIYTGRRSLAGHFFDISDMDIALLINSVISHHIPRADSPSFS